MTYEKNRPKMRHMLNLSLWMSMLRRQYRIRMDVKDIMYHSLVWWLTDGR